MNYLNGPALFDRKLTNIIWLLLIRSELPTHVLSTFLYFQFADHFNLNS